MRAPQTARGAPAETVRDPRKCDRLGQAIDPTDTPPAASAQAAASPQPGFAREVARQVGPRLKTPSWHTVAAALAREEHPAETALEAAMRRALAREGGR